jgi:glycosyltransferase involved in cell wall biosynthesis
VLAYTAKPVIFGLIASRLSGVKNVYAMITGLGYAFTGRSGLLRHLISRLYRVSLRFARTVFFQNRDDEGLLRKLGIVDDSVNTVVLNGSGINLDEYQVAPFPPGACRFLMIGRVLGDKGVREYVAAAKEIRNTFPDTTFGLVGWIDENRDAVSPRELESWVDEGLIDFIGRVEDVRPEICRSHVYVLPSYREGTPRTVLEAMAVGRPIITTDAPGCRETVIDGDNGFLVPIRSVDALVESMQKFIDDPLLGAKMGKRSREIAEEKYDVHKVNAVMLREMGMT